MVEQSPEKACVGGSIPSLATTLNGVVIDSFKILISLSVLSNGVDPTRTPIEKGKRGTNTKDESVIASLHSQKKHAAHV